MGTSLPNIVGGSCGLIDRGPISSRKGRERGVEKKKV